MGALTLTNAGNTIGGDARIEGGTLAISGGGKLTNTIADIGFGAGSVDTVNVSGVGSEWTNTGTVFVGELADGTLSITGVGKHGKRQQFEHDCGNK